MEKEIWEKVAQIIKLSNFYKRYGKKNRWISGSSTVVYPITNWRPNNEIEVQLLGNLQGIHLSANALAKEMSHYINIKDHYLVKSDGSCPNVYRFVYE